MVGYPGQVSDFTHGAEGILGLTVALKAKRHAEGLVVMNLDHLVDAAMALDATDAPVDVNGMVEIDVVRCLVDAYPGYGCPGVEGSITVQVLALGKLAVLVGVLAEIGEAYGFEQWGVCLDVLVAGHTDVGRGYAGMSGLVDR